MSGYKFRRGANYVKPVKPPKTEIELLEEIRFWEDTINKYQKYEVTKYFPIEMKDQLISRTKQYLEAARAKRAVLVLKKCNKNKP